MRVRTIDYFLNHLDSNSKKIVGPKNDREIANQVMAEYFASRDITIQKKAA